MKDDKYSWVKPVVKLLLIVYFALVIGGLVLAFWQTS